jgi:hypothetical protein
MKQNSVILISGGIGIGIIILIASIYSEQETGIAETGISETTTLELNFNNSEIQEISDIDKKLDEIERKASENNYKPPPREWITSGPFQIDRSEYLIGESVFITIGGLEPNEKGQIAFLRNLNETHYSVYQTISFDGEKKNVFNYYTTIRLSQPLGICSIEDLIGEWTVVFRGTNYPNIKFEILDKFLPGEKDSYEKPVC